jgi:predicted RecA/RadA family phage recombinase
MSVPYALYAETSGTASALPSGTTSQTLRHDGSDWVADNTLVNDGSKVGVGDAATEPTAVFEVSSTTQGLLPPRMLQVQLNAIASPAAGLIVYCIDCGVGGEIQFSDGTQWRTMANGIPTPRFAETQLGADIDSEAEFEESGSSVSLSADGSRVAIGSLTGNVRIYTWSGITWVQTGADIDIEGQFEDDDGSSVSLSADGSRVAIGISGNNGANGSVSGHVRIYTWSGITWVQTGADIDGEAEFDLSGSSVSLSADGSRVAIGSIENTGANGSNSGHVRIYTWNGSAWVQTGADIDGEAQGDGSGSSVSLSADGSRVAIGAIFNAGANGSFSGHVRIYTWSGSAWVQTGADIDGEAQGDESGYSVSLSADGSRVAIGAINNTGANGNNSGHVRIYTWNGNAWVQTGADIDGEAQGDESGYSVSLSANGSRVAIGANYNNGANGSASGHVRIYTWSGITWVQTGADIDGEAEFDLSGSSVSLSADGSRVAIGAIGANDSSGHVRVYE